MIRIITSRRLAEMESERHRLREQTGTAEQKAEQALDREVATQLRLAGERDQLEARLSSALFARDVTENANTKLRAEVEELVEEVRRTEAPPSSVFILTELGEIHSVHTNYEAAKAAAVHHGAGGDWHHAPDGKPLSASSWRVTGAHVRAEKPGGAP